MALTKIPASLLDTSGGLDLQGNITLGDNEQIQLGNSTDLAIYHDGSNSYIAENGTGDLYIKATNLILGESSGEQYLVAYANGSVTLYHDNNPKIATSSTGATVTGNLAVTGDLDITGNVNSYNVTDLDVTDQTITLGAGQTEANSGGSGIIIDGSNASLLWNETNSQFDINNALNVSSASTDVARFVSAGSYIFVALDNATRDWALSAGSSFGIYDKDASATRLTIDASGNVGIGTGLPQELLHLSATTPAFRLEGGSRSYQQYVSGTNFIIRDVTATANRITLDASGNVGIGTSSPADKLEVYGDGADTTIRIHEDAGTHIARLHLRRGSNDAYIENDGGLRLRTESTLTGVAPFNIINNGNVGIGTSSPLVNLHVNGTNASIGVLGTPKADWYTTAYNGLQVADGLTLWGRANDSHMSGNYYVKDVSGVAKDSYINNGYAHDLWFDNASGDLKYRNAASGSANGEITSFPTRLVIKNNGNVGIGTTAPSKSLSVKAPSGSNGGIDVFHNNGNKVAELVHHGSGDEGRLSLYDGGTGTVQLHGETGQPSYINSGNVGIGTSSPAAKLAFGGLGQIWVNNDASNPFGLDTAPGELRLFTGNSNSYQMKFGKMATDGTTFTSHLTIGDDGSNRGNVGIGTTSPEALLHLKSTVNTTGPSLIFENTNNGQTMNIDYYNNGGAVQSRIQYAEGPAAWYFQPNVSTADSALTIHYDATVDAGGTPSGSVRTHGVVVSDDHRNGLLGTTLGDTQRVFGLHSKSQNQDFLTFRTRRITGGQSGWNHAVWDITRDIDNTSNLYKYLTFGIGELVVNDESTNLDFRVESDDSTKMLVVDAGANTVYIGDTNADTGAHFSIQNPRDKHHLSMGSAPNSAISATGQANYAEGVVSIPNVSAGTVLSIPHTSQPNLWRPTYIELMFVSGEYNRTAGFGGYAKVSYSMLTYLANVVTVDVGGNVASVSTSGMNLLINFTSGYASGLSNHEGVQMHYRIMSRTPDYFQAWNATLN
jgi:hypothetical protein